MKGGTIHGRVVRYAPCTVLVAPEPAPAPAVTAPSLLEPGPA